jgi:DNA-binding XRE family transcriptional regulator
MPARPPKCFSAVLVSMLESYSMLESNIKDALEPLAYAVRHMETMGQRIKRMRDQRGWSQTELADLVGVTFSAVSQWERDETENVKLLPFLRLAKLFDTDPHYLVFGPGRGAAELSKPVQVFEATPQGLNST